MLPWPAPRPSITGPSYSMGLTLSPTVPNAAAPPLPTYKESCSAGGGLARRHSDTLSSPPDQIYSHFLQFSCCSNQAKVVDGNLWFPRGELGNWSVPPIMSIQHQFTLQSYSIKLLAGFVFEQKQWLWLWSNTGKSGQFRYDLYVVNLVCQGKDILPGTRTKFTKEKTRGQQTRMKFCWTVLCAVLSKIIIDRTPGSLPFSLKEGLDTDYDAALFCKFS